jgi:hypothetical protein
VAKCHEATVHGHPKARTLVAIPSCRARPMGPWKPSLWAHRAGASRCLPRFMSVRPPVFAGLSSTLERACPRPVAQASDAIRASPQRVLGTAQNWRLGRARDGCPSSVIACRLDAHAHQRRGPPAAAEGLAKGRYQTASAGPRADPANLVRPFLQRRFSVARPLRSTRSRISLKSSLVY